MLSTLLIALREGLEASLIVGILIAYLVRAGRREALPAIWGGVAVAAILALALGALLSFTSAQLSLRGEELFAGVTSILAVALVTWMVFWMKRTAGSYLRGLHQHADLRIGERGPSIRYRARLNNHL